MTKFNNQDYNNITAQWLNELEGKEYITALAHVLKLALIRDASFYEWLILNFNEIMDKDNAALNQIEAKCNIIMQYFNTKDPKCEKEYKLLQFGDCFADAISEYFGEKFFYGECMSLGMIANAYISYKRELLSKEEFYEIRDMFVPFGLTISLDPFDKTDILTSTYSKIEELIKNNSFVLLKKTGKAGFYNDITFDEVNIAIEQLLVEWD